MDNFPVPVLAESTTEVQIGARCHTKGDANECSTVGGEAREGTTLNQTKDSRGGETFLMVILPRREAVDTLKRSAASRPPVFHGMSGKRSDFRTWRWASTGMHACRKPTDFFVWLKAN